MPFPATNCDQSLVSPHGTKRQRRPSVRLGEIGDQPAAFMAERRNKKETADQSAFFFTERRKKETIDQSSFSAERRKNEILDQNTTLLTEGRKKEIEGRFAASFTTERRKKPTSVLTNNTRLKENTVDLERNRVLVCTPGNHRKSGRSSKTWSSFHPNNGRLQGDGDGLQHTVMPPDVSSTCTIIVPKESWLDLNRNSHGAVCVRSSEKFVKNINREGHNTDNSSRLDSFMENVEENSDPEDLKELHSDDAEDGNVNEIHSDDEEGDAKDIHSDEGNECHTPEGFRDCDLDELDEQNDMKETSNSMESRPQVKFQPEQISQKISRKYLLEGGQEIQERTGGNVLTWKNIKQNCKELKKNWEDDIKTKALQEEKQWNDLCEQPISECGGNKEAPKQHFHLLNGIAGWLEDLGLTKYAQHFEVHEVDPQVLPLLTLDDLKEMGIPAVGSRRKMFCAIQQLANSL